MRSLALLAPLFFCLSAPAFAGDITVKNAYARPTLKGTTTGVILMEVTSAKGDVLESVQTPVAAKAELHDHLMEGGMMRMRQVPNATLEPGKTLQFRSGGLHVMLFDMKRELKLGETVDFTLHFKNAGDINVTAPVANELSEDDVSPMGDSHDAHAHH